MSTLTVRKLEIDLSHGFGRRWWGGDAYRSQLFNALSMSFPIGEQTFIDSVRAVPPERLLDPVLRAEVRDFIGQEASHRFVHVQYNAELARQGLTYVIEPSVLRRVRFAAKLDVRSRLAVTCAYEHYTAMLADWVLRHPECMADAEPSLRTLWLWHAAEESEHKAVAFDVYLAAGGKYWRRVLWYVHISFMFAMDTLVQTTHNLHRSGQLWRLRTWASAANTWFGRRGLFWHLLLPSLQYLAPGFHPWRHDNRHLVDAWLRSNEGAYRAIGTTAPVSAGEPREVS
ncbi:MAG TPA: metal-dependent hydrolase [Telluria sp.]